jgi:hypothetical protein
MYLCLCLLCEGVGMWVSEWVSGRGQVGMICTAHCVVKGVEQFTILASVKLVCVISHFRCVN